MSLQLARRVYIGVGGVTSVGFAYSWGLKDFPYSPRESHPAGKTVHALILASLTVGVGACLGAIWPVSIPLYQYFVWKEGEDKKEEDARRAKRMRRYSYSVGPDAS